MGQIKGLERGFHFTPTHQIVLFYSSSIYLHNTEYTILFIQVITKPFLILIKSNNLILNVLYTSRGVFLGGSNTKQLKNVKSTIIRGNNSIIFEIL